MHRKKSWKAIWQSIKIFKMVISRWWDYSQLYFLNVLGRVWILLESDKTVNVISRGKEENSAH